MAEATVNGVRLAYELQGHGTPILFLPGTSMVKEAWLDARPWPWPWRATRLCSWTTVASGI